jgi:MFS family permease
MLMENKVQSGRAWLMVIVASLFFFYEFIQMNMFNSLADSFERTFHLTVFQVGLVSGFYFLSDSILLYPAGVMLDRFSSKKLMLLGMLMCIVGTLLIATAQNSWFLVIARFLAGLSSAFCLLSILRLAAQWFPASRMGEASGVAVTIGMLGGAVSQVPLTYLIDTFTWRKALLIVMAVGIVIYLLIALIVRDAPVESRYAGLQGEAGHLKLPFWRTLWELMKNKNNWYAGLYTCMMNLPIILLAGLFGVQYMQQGHGLSTVQSSSVSMMIFIGTIVGSTVFGFISDWLGSRRKPMLWAAILSLVLFLGIMYVPGLSYQEYLWAFFALGLITAAQIISYPVTRECNPGILVGSALGFISVIIMGLPTFLQPITGWLMSLNWQGQMSGGVAIYSLADYNRGLWVLVIGFVISIVCALLLPETYGKKYE